MVSAFGKGSEQVTEENRERNTTLVNLMAQPGFACAEGLADVLEEIAAEWCARSDALEARNAKGWKGTKEKLYYAATELRGIAVSLRRDGVTPGPGAVETTTMSDPVEHFVAAGKTGGLIDQALAATLEQTGGPSRDETLAFLTGKTDTLPPLDAPAPPDNVYAAGGDVCGNVEPVGGARCAKAPHGPEEAHEGDGCRWANEEPMPPVARAALDPKYAQEVITAMSYAESPLPDPFTDPLAASPSAWRPPADPVGFSCPPTPPPDHVSVSQITTGEACGLQLRILKRDKAPGLPAWWNIGGAAFATCAELIEMSRAGMLETMAAFSGDSADACMILFSKHFTKAIEAAEQASGFDRSTFRAAKKGSEGYAWWMENGPLMVRDYAAWSTRHRAEGWSLWRPTLLTVAVEWAFSMHVPYGYGESATRIDGRVDAVWMRPRADAAAGESPVEFLVVDDKTSADVSADTFQRGVYGHAVADALGLPPGFAIIKAAHYDARNGKLVDEIDPLTAVSRDEIYYRAAMVNGMHATGTYPANPVTKYGGPCGICEVRHRCPIMARRES